MFKPLTFIKRLLLLTLITLIFLVVFVGFTNSGLRAALYIANSLFKVNISVKQTEGYLLGNFSLHQLNYQDKTTTIKAQHVALGFSPLQLLRWHINVNKLTLNDAIIETSTTQTVNKHQQSSSLTLANIPSFMLKNIELSNIKIILDDDIYPIKALHLDASNNNDALVLTSFHLDAFATKVSAFGQLGYGKTFPLTFKLTSSGQINQETTALGDLHHYTLKTYAKSPYQASITGFINNLKQFSLNANVNDVALNKKTKIKNAKLLIEGLTNDYRIQFHGLSQHHPSGPWINSSFKGHGSLQTLILEQLHITDKNSSLNGKLNLQFAPYFSWQGNIKTHQFDLSDFNASLKSNIDATLSVQGKLIDHEVLANNIFNIRGNLFDKSLKANGSINYPEPSHFNMALGKNTLSIEGNFLKKAQVHLSIPDTSTIIPNVNVLKSSFSLDGVIGPQTTLKAKLNPGHISLDGTHQLAINGLDALLTYQDREADFFGKLNINHKNYLDIHASSKINHQQLLKSPIKGALHLKLAELNFIEKLTTNVNQVQGDVDIRLIIDGLLKKPNFSATGHLNRAQAFIAPLNVLFSSISLSLNTQGDTWHLNGRVNTQGQTLTINGQGKTDFDASHYQIKISGRDVIVINNKQYLIQASPDITLQSQANHLLLKGQINIPKARISPTDFSSSEELPSDVIIIQDGEPIGTRQAIGLNLDLHLGQQVAINTNGLTGRISGKLHINARPNQLIHARGHLKFIDGKFNAYGQDLSITQGDIEYHGGVINNPLINIRAVRIFEAQGNQQLNINTQSGPVSSLHRLEAGIRATGRVRRPNITLFSNPPVLSQADILSMIVLGRPAHQAGDASGGSEALIGALSSLNLGGGSSGQQLTGELQHALGFDVSLETQSNYNEDGTISQSPAVLLSKSISSKVKMQFSAGLGDGANIIRILYDFKPNWSLVTETSGSATGFDVLYNYRRK